MTGRRNRLAAGIVLGAALAQGCGVVPPSRPPLDILVEKEVANLKVGLLAPDHAAQPLRLDRRMEELGVTQVSIALVHEGELRWARSFGDRPEAPTPEADSEPDEPSAFPRPSVSQKPVTEFAATIDVGNLVEIPLAILALRPNEEASDTAERMNDEILGPLGMSHSRFANGKLDSTAEDLTRILTDLQKSHAGKPARRLAQNQARAVFGTRPTDIEGALDLGLRVEGTGQAIRFERRATTASHTIQLVGFVYSGHGAVIIVDNPEAGPLVDEIVAGLAELYDWPAFRAGNGAADSSVSSQ